jgi:hypothetical protein
MGGSEDGGYEFSVEDAVRRRLLYLCSQHHSMVAYCLYAAPFYQLHSLPFSNWIFSNAFADQPCISVRQLHWGRTGRHAFRVVYLECVVCYGGVVLGSVIT